MVSPTARIRTSLFSSFVLPRVRFSSPQSESVLLHPPPLSSLRSEGLSSRNNLSSSIPSVFYSSTTPSFFSSSSNRNTTHNNSTFSSSSASSSSSPSLIPSLQSQQQQRNREALRLYRDILRVCKQFNFPDDQGRHWGEVLAKSARQEFENSRALNPSNEEVTRLLVIGTDALMQIQQKFAVAEERLIKAVTTDLSSSTSSSPPSSGNSLMDNSSTTMAPNGGMIMQQVNTTSQSSSPSSRSSKTRPSSPSSLATIIEVEESVYTTHERANDPSHLNRKK